MSFIRQLIAQLAARGVREWVVATGARNLEIVRELTGARGARLWHGFEERSCGFFALGRIQAGGWPVAVVTTSGTAVAELLPAVIEAHYEGRPLVLLTADRPASFRGSGAPQAIEQAGLLREWCGLAVDLTSDGTRVEDGAVWDMPGQLPWNRPSHLNVCLEEPEPCSGEREGLSIDARQDGVIPTAPDHEQAQARRQVEAFVAGDSPIVALVAGLDREEERHGVAGWLRRSGLPALWETTTGWGDPSAGAAKGTPPGCPANEQLLDRMEVGRVLRIGSVPSWRWWRDLEQREKVEVLSLSRSGHRGLGRASGCSGLDVDPARLGEWEAAMVGCPGRIPVDDTANRLREAMKRLPGAEPVLLAALNRAIGQECAVFLGNSLPIREWNLGGAGAPGRACHAARGANGIDGQVSQALGVAAECGELWVVIGDLTALYDLSGPSWLGQAGLSGCRIRLVVVNNGGGRIFSRLAAFRGLSEKQRQVTENRHGTGFKSWAALWDMGHVLVETVADLDALASDAHEGLGDRVVVELRPDEEQTARFWEQW